MTVDILLKHCFTVFKGLLRQNLSTFAEILENVEAFWSCFSWSKELINLVPYNSIQLARSALKLCCFDGETGLWGFFPPEKNSYWGVPNYRYHWILKQSVPLGLVTCLYKALYCPVQHSHENCTITGIQKLVYKNNIFHYATVVIIPI